MATLILKGGKDAKMECSSKVCASINKMKQERKSPNTPIVVDGIFLELGDIRYALPGGELDSQRNRDGEKESNDKYLRDVILNFDKEILSYANGNLEKKLQFNLSVAKMYCFAITGGEIDEYKSQLKPIFIEELKKEKLVVNPTKYIKLFKINEPNGKEGLSDIKYFVRKSPIKFIESYLSNVYMIIKR